MTPDRLTRWHGVIRTLLFMDAYPEDVGDDLRALSEYLKTARDKDERIAELQNIVALHLEERRWFTAASFSDIEQAISAYRKRGRKYVVDNPVFMKHHKAACWDILRIEGKEIIDRGQAVGYDNAMKHKKWIEEIDFIEGVLEELANHGTAARKARLEDEMNKENAT